MFRERSPPSKSNSGGVCAGGGERQRGLRGRRAAEAEGEAARAQAGAGGPARQRG